MRRAIACQHPGVAQVRSRRTTIDTGVGRLQTLCRERQQIREGVLPCELLRHEGVGGISDPPPRLLVGEVLLDDLGHFVDGRLHSAFPARMDREDKRGSDTTSAPAAIPRMRRRSASRPECRGILSRILARFSSWVRPSPKSGCPSSFRRLRHPPCCRRRRRMRFRRRTRRSPRKSTSRSRSRSSRRVWIG